MSSRLLFRSPTTYTDQGQTGPKLEAGNATQGSHSGGQNPRNGGWSQVSRYADAGNGCLHRQAHCPPPPFFPKLQMELSVVYKDN